MKKVTALVLMLCFILSGALCYANSEAGMVEKGDGVTVTVGLIEDGALWETFTNR